MPVLAVPAVETYSVASVIQFQLNDSYEPILFSESMITNQLKCQETGEGFFSFFFISQKNR